MIPTHTCPSCVQTAEPSGLLGRFHFTSSAISGSASWTSLRSFASIAPRQSGVFAINSSTGPARDVSLPARDGTDHEQGFLPGGDVVRQWSIRRFVRQVLLAREEPYERA